MRRRVSAPQRILDEAARALDRDGADAERAPLEGMSEVRAGACIARRIDDSPSLEELLRDVG